MTRTPGVVKAETSTIKREKPSENGINKTRPSAVSVVENSLVFCFEFY